MKLDDDTDPSEALRLEIARVGDRLRLLALDRLRQVDSSGSSLEARAHHTAQVLADLAADAAGRGRRPVPVLATHAVADQVVLTAGDVLAEAGPDVQIRAVEALRTLRLSQESGKVR